MITSDPPALAKLIDDVVEISIEAGNAILGYYKTDQNVEYKENSTPLTQADLAANAIIERGLNALRPLMPIISEESALPDYEDRSKWEYFWLIDPMDGTKSFVNETDQFTVNIALMKTDSPVLGVVHWPTKNHTYWGYLGSDAYYRNGFGETKKIQVREFGGTTARLICSSKRGMENVNKLVRILEQNSVHCHITTSSSSLKLCRVATGDADIFPGFSLTHEWDTAAAQSVVQSAGGRVTDFNGDVLKYNKPDPKLQNPSFLVMGGGDFNWVKYIQRV